jgi:arylsulfatase A-like enzyme
VHAPFSAPEERIEPYEKKMEKLGLTDEERFDQEEIGDKNFIYRRKQDHPPYAAMVESVDMAVGKVLDKLKQKGIEDNTIVIFFSDNGGLSTSEGTPTANTPLRTGKGWLYEGGIRVPAIIKWPGVRNQGRVSDAVITSMDFYPTILEMAGLPLRPGIHHDGKSLVPLLKNKVEKVHDASYFHYPHYSNQRGVPSSAIREGNYKLIVFFDDKRLELYDLNKDIGETINLADEFPEVRDRLYKKLQAWWDEVDAGYFLAFIAVSPCVLAVTILNRKVRKGLRKGRY